MALDTATGPAQIKNEMPSKIIQLTQGQVAVVDAEDYDRLAAMGKWYAQWNPEGRCYYAKRREGGKLVLMHHVVVGAAPGSEVDHINRNSLDNRRFNLRTCTTQQNCQNQGVRKSNRSGFKGVCADRGRWRATIMVNRKQIYLGKFDDAEHAAKIYDAYARQYFGEFAYLNFPLDESSRAST